MDATEVPGPACPLVIESQEPLINEHMQKLDHEERIAVRLRVHQSSERISLLGAAAKRVRNKISEVIGRQRRQLDILHPSGCAERLHLAHERMHCGDLVIAEGTDEEEITKIGLAQQVFQKVERRRIEPLQVIEEKREGMFRPSKDTDQLPKHHLEASLRVLRRKFNDRRQPANEELQFGYEIDHQSSVRP